MTGVVFDIRELTVHDGPGMRTTVFLKGCPLRCAWCHNPEGLSPTPQIMRGATGERLAGRSYTSSELAAILNRQVPLLRDYGGVTFSGGEPLMQAAFLAQLVDECRARAIRVAVDTSGFADPASVDAVRPDLFLFDVKAVDEAWHRHITGASNRAILENLARLAGRDGAGRAGGAGRDLPSPPTRLIVRFPLVPGLTDGDDNVRAIARLVASLGIARVDVLPYHRAGLAKYERLGRPYTLPSTEPPTPDQVRRAVEVFEVYRLNVRVGGV